MSEKPGSIKTERSRALITKPKMDDIFENFRREMESMFSPLLPYSLNGLAHSDWTRNTWEMSVCLYVIW